MRQGNGTPEIVRRSGRAVSCRSGHVTRFRNGVGGRRWRIARDTRPNEWDASSSETTDSSVATREHRTEYMQPTYQPAQRYSPMQQMHQQSAWGALGPYQQHVPTQAVQQPSTQSPVQQLHQQPMQQQPHVFQQPIPQIPHSGQHPMQQLPQLTQQLPQFAQHLPQFAQQLPQFAQQPMQYPSIQQPFHQQPVSQPGQLYAQLQPSTQQLESGQFLGQSWQGQGQRLPVASTTPFQQALFQPSPQGIMQAGYGVQPGTQVPSQSIGPAGIQPISESMQFAPGQIQQPGFELGMGQQTVHGQELPTSSPLVDILVSPEDITLLADLPGFTEDDIQIQASGNTLHISAIRPAETEEEDRLLQHERLHRFERTITLPVQIDVEQAEASCEDGVCKITLPKSEEMKEKSIAFQ